MHEAVNTLGAQQENVSGEKKSEIASLLQKLLAFLEDKHAALQCELVGIAEVASMLGVGERTARKLDVEGRLPCALKIGKSKRWRLAELRKWLDAGAPGRLKWESVKDR
ncbi:MAG: helix-turn-helix domain-containing protein [Planctomycetes bacterium]|nr:helix-turn-helix domain-containing protein [Planctomycetota bacterium]